MTKLEEVAREIYEVATGNGGWADVEESVRLSFMAQARAAIEALREPDGVIMMAGSDAGIMNDESRFQSYGLHAGELWKAMIDAILSEGDS